MTGDERKGTKGYKFAALCTCGSTAWMRWSDLKTMAADGKDHHCKPCAMRIKAAAFMATVDGVAHQRKMSRGAAARGRTVWSCAEEAALTRILLSAKQRCTNPRNAAWDNYGGRGIQFLFDSTREATRWVIDNLGLPPHGKSLDRIDNNRHYEPGNLRWATREEQARNRRAYKNAVPNLKVAKAIRPDLSDSQLRLMLKRGDSLETIKNWRRYESAYADRRTRV